jgi:integrase
MKPRERYQQGSVVREKRRRGEDVWTFRWRETNADGSVTRRKSVIGTEADLHTKAAALKACEFLRSTINRETRTPRTVAELVDHYIKNELPNRNPYTQEVYKGYLNTWIVPKWGNHSLSDVRPVGVEAWLGTLKQLANGTRAKFRNIMSAIFSHAIRWEFFDRNPIKSVRQSAKRRGEPVVLTVEELKALLSELEGIYRVMVYVSGVTGLRVSEVIGLRWSDCDFEAGEIRLKRGIVRQYETEMKSEASRKPVPLEADLAEVLMDWHAECAYNQPNNYIFASIEMDGRQPLWPNSAMEGHIRPAAIRTGIMKRIGWHTLRHTFGTLLKANGEDVATVQALMRHANVSVTMDHYVQAVTPAKRKAQRGISGMLEKTGPLMDPRESGRSR